MTVPNIGQTPEEQFYLRQYRRIRARGGTDLDFERYMDGLAPGTRESIRRSVAAEPESKGPENYLPDPGKIGGLSMAAWQGLTMSWGDEALGWLAGYGSYVKNVVTHPFASKAEWMKLQGEAEAHRDAVQESARELDAAFRQNHPILAAGGNMAGALLPILATGGAAAPEALGAQGAGRLAAIGKLAATGAGVGAVTAAGAADGPMSERAKSALIGGAAGAVVSPIAGAAFNVGARVLSAGINLLRKGAVAAASTVLGDDIGPRVAAAYQRLQQSWTDHMANSSLIGRVLDKTVRNRVQEVETLGNATTAWRGAREILADALARGGRSMDELLAEARARELQGIPSSVVDILDEKGAKEVVSLGIAAQGTRGEQQQMLMNELGLRADQSGKRTIAQLLKSVARDGRFGSQNAYEFADELETLRRAHTMLLRQTYYNRSIPMPPALQEGLARFPEMREAYELARRNAQAVDDALTGLRGGEIATPIPGSPRGIAVTGPRVTPPVPTTPTVTEVLSGEARLGNGPPIPSAPLKSGTAIPTRVFDYLPDALDEVINQSGRNLLKHNAIEVNQVQELRSSLLNIMDEVGGAEPNFALARRNYPSHAEWREAMAQGKGGTRKVGGVPVVRPRFHERTLEETLQELRGLAKASPALPEAYRLGALHDLADLVSTKDSKTLNLAKMLFDGRVPKTRSAAANAMQDKLRVLWGDTEGGAIVDMSDALFNEAISTERGASLVAALGRSESQGAALARMLVNVANVAQLGTLMPGGIPAPVGVAGAGLTYLLRRAQQNWSESVSDELSNLLAKGLDDPHGLSQLLESLKPLVQARARGRAVQAAVGSAAASTAVATPLTNPTSPSGIFPSDFDADAFVKRLSAAKK